MEIPSAIVREGFWRVKKVPFQLHLRYRSVSCWVKEWSWFSDGLRPWCFILFKFQKGFVWKLKSKRVRRWPALNQSLFSLKVFLPLIIYVKKYWKKTLFIISINMHKGKKIFFFWLLYLVDLWPISFS